MKAIRKASYKQIKIIESLRSKTGIIGKKPSSMNIWDAAKYIETLLKVKNRDIYKPKEEKKEPSLIEKQFKPKTILRKGLTNSKIA